MDSNRLCRYTLQFCLSIQIVLGLDKVTLLNPPEEPTSGHPLKVLYSCDKTATVWLECIVSFDTGAMSTLTLGHWTCVPGKAKIKVVRLGFPDWLVYRADGIVPDVQWVLSAVLRVSVGYSGLDDRHRSVLVQDVATLQPVPSLSRPRKQHPLCPAWSAEMLLLAHKTWKSQCPLEKETVHLLSSMYASTGENFGITKVLGVYGDKGLEYLRLKAVAFPWCMFSIWVFVIRHCQQSMCGVFHHIDSHENYFTPALFLTSSGKLHVQMNGESGDSSAFLCPFQVPLNQWCNFNVALRGRAVTVSMKCTDDKKRHIVHSSDHTFRHPVTLDDTDGYFVIGGGKYVRGLEGFYGPLVYYRNRIPQYSTSDVAVPEIIENVNLMGWLQACQEFRLDLNVKITGYSLKARKEAESERCVDAYYNWMVKDTRPLNLSCEPWEETFPRKQKAAKLAKFLVFKHGGREVTLASVGKALYASSLRKLSKASRFGELKKILPLLLQADCLGNNEALHLSASLYNTGLGVKRQPIKAWLLTLLAAQKDSRLALLRLGYLHQQGDLDFPPDTDLAYAYYANIAKQTTVDRQKQSAQQTFVESIYLNNEEVLELQTNENHHIFQWLSLQARNGAAEAEQAIGRMLFWGQQGVSPDIQKAVRHYERGATRLRDPVAMYDYAIVLMQGHGVEKDIPRAVAFLKKAMEQGFSPAINALGWYYEQFEKDYERAVQLWEQADLHGSPDAAMNLGVMYSQGLYPGKAADQSMAYKYYLKSAQRGHVSGAVHLADLWTTGIPGHVERRPSDAVLWAKWAAEHNGYLGKVLRRALDSYLESDMLMSFLFYVMAAESGFVAAQFNVAYLCEQNLGDLLDPDFAVHCMKKYYNLTIQSQTPDTYALIRMGDLLYEVQKDLFSAAHMYKKAALGHNAQGWHNLGFLVEEGYRLPLSVLIELGLSELYLADSNVLVTTLYTRCRDSEGTDSYLPCALSLFSVYWQSFQKDYIPTIKLSSTLAVVVAAPPVVIIVLSLLRGRGLSPH
ncbi:protein sel-1 homolog 3 [Lampris incognitus]|uniref:protein sel-1 homolog 3 n=1 Tax=Lampris incognitus TaxID=2546036 RepID=UPI0024B60F12|nr:protein sel-1 homolog 3 [Lampris incognitus]